MAEVNLAPGSQRLAAARKRRRTLYGLSVVIVVFVVGVWVSLQLVERQYQSQLAAEQQQVASLRTQVASSGTSAERIDLFEKRLAAMDALLDSHLRWTPLLAEVEQLLPPQIVLSELQVNHTSRRVELSGFSPSVDELAIMLASFNSGRERQTSFASAEFESVVREEVRDEAGEIVAAQYRFSAVLLY